MADSRYTPLRIVALLALVIGVWVAGLLCYRVAATDSFWLDELHTVWTIQQPDDASFAIASSSGNQSPFYFRIVQKLSGANVDSPLQLRWFSILCSLLSVASLGFFVWYWSRSIYGSALAVWSAGIDPRLVFYGSEARPYALLMLLAIWQFFVFCHLTIRQSVEVESENTITPSTHSRPLDGRRWAKVLLLWLLSTVLVLTHQTGILLLAAEFLILIGLRKKSRTSVWWVGAAIVFAGLLVFIWQSSTYSAVMERRSQWNTLSSVGGLASDFRNSIVFLLVVPLLVLYWISGQGYFRSRPQRLFCLSVVAAGGLLPPVLAGSAHFFGLAPLGLFRYTLTGAILLPLFAGLAVASVRREWLQLVLAVAIVCAGIFCPLPESSADGKSNELRSANVFIVDATNCLNDKNEASVFRMRYESWPRAVAAIEELDDERPVFLFANLLEDAQISGLESEGKANEVNDVLINYLRFPLAAFSVSPERVVPRPTLSGNAFQSKNIEQIIAAKGCWVLTRCDATTFARISRELNAGLEEIKDAEFNVRTKFVRLTDDRDEWVPEWLSLFRIDLVPLR